MTCLQARFRELPAVQNLLHRQYRRLAMVEATSRSVVVSAVDESAALFAVLAPEVAPEIPPPLPYARPASVRVSEKFISSLRRDYGPGRRNDEGQRIGAMAEVRRWIDGLKPGVHLLSEDAQ